MKQNFIRQNKHLVELRATYVAVLYLKNAMPKAAFSISTPFRLFIPAKLSLRRTRCKICTTNPSKFGNIITRRRTLSCFISMIHINLLNVTTVSNCYIHGPTRVQTVIIHSIHSLIGVHLKIKKVAAL